MIHDDTLASVVSCQKILVSMTCTVPTRAPAQYRAKGPVFFSYATGQYISVGRALESILAVTGSCPPVARQIF